MVGAALLSLGLALGAMGCREEGPAEKAGKKVDEAFEDLRDGGEGTLEKMGREIDEALDETEEAAEEVERAVRGED